MGTYYKRAAKHGVDAAQLYPAKRFVEDEEDVIGAGKLRTIHAAISR
jgi:hypothetical protein